MQAWSGTSLIIDLFTKSTSLIYLFIYIINKNELISYF